MKMHGVRILIFLFGIFVSLGQGSGSDPYKILRKHYHAIGGMSRVKAIETRYSVGTFEIVERGVQAPLREWESLPDCIRTEIQFGDESYITAHSGELSWTEDQSGKIDIEESPAQRARLQLRTRMNRLEHLDRKSSFFRLEHCGMQLVDSTECHCLRITSPGTQDTLLHYYGSEDFILYRIDQNDTDGQSTILFADYRGVNGVLHSFQYRVTYHQYAVSYLYTLDSIATNVDLGDICYDPPELIPYR